MLNKKQMSYAILGCAIFLGLFFVVGTISQAKAKVESNLLCINKTTGSFVFSENGHVTFYLEGCDGKMHNWEQGAKSA